MLRVVLSVCPAAGCECQVPVPVFQVGSGICVTARAGVSRRVGARRPAACVGERAVLSAAVVFDGVDAQHLAAGGDLDCAVVSPSNTTPRPLSPAVRCSSRAGSQAFSLW